MNTRLSLYSLPVALVWCVTAQAAVDISQLDQGMAGPRAQVLVLGTAHLSHMPKGFDPESLEPVLERLAAFKPQIITIEGLSGETCDLMARQPAVYDPQVVTDYCHDTAPAHAATGLDVTSAIAQVTKTLADWPAHPSPAERRYLAALFMASGDDTSALVQWLQLPAADQHAGDGLDDALVKKLNELMTSNNEDYRVAARLAARLGLQRVYPVDDHTGDNIVITDEEAYDKAITQAWAAGAALAKDTRQHEEDLKQSGDMLALYKFINSPDYLRIAIESDFGEALKDKSPQHFGQLYVAAWETRNLRMASNVRAAFRDTPGARVLCIVGSSHKPWFDNLLGLMQGVDVLDTEKVLAAPAK